MQSQSHRRKNLLSGDWVLVSPHRTQRPWKGQLDEPEQERLPDFDPECYLCPGNERAGGVKNPAYSGSWAFDNDFAALSMESDIEASSNPMFVAAPESGCCRVVCFSEQHDLRLAAMSPDQIAAALHFLFRQFAELDARPDIQYVQIFENRGQMMGCSNQHPHAQIWATSGLPLEPAKEQLTQSQWFESHGKALLTDYLEAECKDGSRLVCENEHAVSLVPFWALWPYETLLIPRRPVAGPEMMSAEEVLGLASVLGSTLRACEQLFKTALPYSMGFHARPSDGRPHPEWQFHAHIFPPLLRSASIRKHLVGFEMLAMPQRDLTPEVAAARLREALDIA